MKKNWSKIVKALFTLLILSGIGFKSILAQPTPKLTVENISKAVEETWKNCFNRKPGFQSKGIKMLPSVSSPIRQTAGANQGYCRPCVA